ncbi:MAG TPA: DUF3150 domain-containing protein [Rhodanobacteraceae bacterium]|nr:DUF3150 domain-containing protein [Rhodanobacteraceae bacterium]
MPIKTPKEIASGLTMLYPSITTWTGTVSVKRESHLATVASQLPPKELITDGVIHLIEPKKLAPPASRRREVDRAIIKVGFAFMGGYALKDEDLDRVLTDIERIEKEYWADVNHICANLESLYDERARSFPHWAHLIETNKLEGAQARARYSFSVTPMKMAQPPAESKAVMAFERGLDGIQDAVLASIASQARDMATRLFGNRQAAMTRRSINRIWEILEKVDSFSYIDARMAPVKEKLSAMLDALPVKEPFSPTDIGVVSAVLAQLQDPEALLNVGQAMFAATDAITPSLLLEEAPSIADEPSVQLNDEAVTSLPPPPLSQPGPEFVLAW